MSQTNPFDSSVDAYESWFIDNRQLFEAEVEAIRQLLPRFEKAVEIGVGTGLFAQRLGIKEGIEPSAAMREKAESRGIQIIDAVAESLPLHNATYDLVLMVTVDCFLSNIEQAYREIARILKPGGTFITAFIDKSSPLGIVYNEKKKYSPFYAQAHFHSAKEIHQQIQQVGLMVQAERQTVFTLQDEPQGIKIGTGEGVFAVIKAIKTD